MAQEVAKADDYTVKYFSPSILNSALMRLINCAESESSVENVCLFSKKLQFACCI